MIGTLILLSACAVESPPRVEVKVLSTIGAGVGDLAFVDEVVKGVALAKLQADFFLEFAEPQTFEEADALFHAFLQEQQRHDSVLIITVGAEYINLVESRNCDFAGRYVLHLDQNLTPCPDLKSASFRTYASSFLAGVAAVAMSARGRVAALGGMKIPPVDEFLDGYTAGVAYAGGELTAVEYLAEDFSGFSDPALAAETARRLWQEADVILPVAGGSTIGVIEAAKEFGAEDPRYVIGVDTDQSVHGVNVVIGSVTKNLKQVTASTIIEASAGKFSAGALRMGLGEGGSDFLINPIFADRIEAVVAAAHAAALAAETVAQP